EPERVPAVPPDSPCLVPLALLAGGISSFEDAAGDDDDAWSEADLAHLPPPFRRQRAPCSGTTAGGSAVKASLYAARDPGQETATLRGTFSVVWSSVYDASFNCHERYAVRFRRLDQ